MRAPAQTKAVEVSVMLTGDDVTALRFNPINFLVRT